MNRGLFSGLHPAVKLFVSFGLLAALLFPPASSEARAVGLNRLFSTMHALAPVSAQGSVVSATVTQIGSDFQIHWTTTGDVEKVKIEEGTSPEQIGTLIGEVSGTTSMTVSGLDPNQRHYFHVSSG